MVRSKLFAVVAAQAFDQEMMDPNCIVAVTRDEAKANLLAAEGEHYVCTLTPVARGDAAIDVEKEIASHPHATVLSGIGRPGIGKLSSPEEIAADIARDFVIDGDPSSGPLVATPVTVHAGIAAAIRRERGQVNLAGIDVPSPDQIADRILDGAGVGGFQPTKASIRERIVLAIVDERSRDYDALRAEAGKRFTEEQRRMFEAAQAESRERQPRPAPTPQAPRRASPPLTRR